MQADHIVGAYSSCELQPYAKGTELNGYCADIGAALHDRKWEFSSGQEACFLSVQSQQVRFSQDFEYCFLLKISNRDGQVYIGPEQENIQNVRKCKRGLLSSTAGADRS